MIFWITFRKVKRFFGKSRSEEFLFFTKNGRKNINHKTNRGQDAHAPEEKKKEVQNKRSALQKLSKKNLSSKVI